MGTQCYLPLPLVHPVKQASPQSGYEECINSVLPCCFREVNPVILETKSCNRWRPNGDHFKGNGSVLSALHYNENADNAQATTQSGELRWRVKHPKARHGEATVSSIKVDPSYKYVRRLLEAVQQDLCEHASGEYRLASPPPPLTTFFGIVNKEGLVATHLSRFSNK
ncbi:hypothetical protein MTO96_038395 [Rhipicephalus appendiculatus]